MIEIFIKFLLWVQNFFGGKCYSFYKAYQASFIFDCAYDRVVRDYYLYVNQLLINNLNHIKSPCIIFFGCPNFFGLNFLSKAKHVALQIEHTLVKPRARDSSDGFPGFIYISNSPDKYLIRVVNFSELMKADIIFEYSQINQFNIGLSNKLRSYYAKSFCISPALYNLDPNLLLLSGKRTFDTITLFGNPCEPRRRRFLDDLSSLGVRCANVNNVFDNVEGLYRSTKILINIRQTDHHDTLEELRILPALRCGVIVISERAPLIELTGYSKYIIWGELHELPDIALDVQNNYEQWHQRIFDNSGFIKRMERIARRNELVASKAVQLINDQLLKV